MVYIHFLKILLKARVICLTGYRMLLNSALFQGVALLTQVLFVEHGICQALYLVYKLSSHLLGKR